MQCRDGDFLVLGASGTCYLRIQNVKFENMNAMNLGPVGLTVDELIQSLQKASDEGHGAAPAHALMGDHTGPLRGVDMVPGWGIDAQTVVLVMADHDGEATGTVLRVRGDSMTGGQA